MAVLRSELENAIKYFPLLNIAETNGELSLIGEIELIHPIEKEIIDTFSVSIAFPPAYPSCFPKVIETSQKIERIANRHVFVDTNTLCFAVVAEERMKCRNEINLLWFLNTVLVPRLAEEYRVNNGERYSHEYSHGPKGDLEFYSEKFKTQSPVEVIRLLKLILVGGFPKPFEKCICGSDLKFKKCHRMIFEDLKLLGDNFLSYEIVQLENFIRLLDQNKREL